MSHFNVMVIGSDVEKILAPYHEFECTGHVDEYVQDVDLTDEKRNDWENDTRTMVRTPSGELIHTFDDVLFRDPTPEEREKIGPMRGTGFGHGMSWRSKDWCDGRGYRTKVRDIPEGYEEVELKLSELMTFREYVTEYLDGDDKCVAHDEDPDIHGDHKFGHVRLDEHGDVAKVIDRTNPNAKWDWWVVGGRWSGKLRAKPDAVAAGRVGRGRPGLMGSCQNEGDLWVDQARKGDIDWGYMRNDAERKAAEEFDYFAPAFELGVLPEFREVVEVKAKALAGPDTEPKVDSDVRDAAREEYQSLPVVVKLKELAAESDERGLPFMSDYAEHFCHGDRAKFLARARVQAVSTYAVATENGWVARGDMGWFGMSLNEVDPGQWEEQLAAKLDSLPDETLITIVDCHI